MKTPTRFSFHVLFCGLHGLAISCLFELAAVYCRKIIWANLNFSVLTFYFAHSSEFLAPGAKAEINIDGKTMEATKQAMKTPTRFTFEVAAGHVYLLLLKKDCYPRFIRSENYKSILANAINPGNVRRR